MTRLRKIVTTPYLKGAVALIGQHSADGYGGVDIIDSAASEASAEYAGGAGVTLTTFIGALIAQLTYADKVSIIPDLIERGFCVSQHVNQDGDPRYPPLGVIPGHYANMCPMSLAFQYQWSDLDKRHQEEHGPLGSGAWGPAHSPPPPRFAVGTAVECKLGSEEDWVPGEVVRIGWPEAFGDMGPAVPADGCDFICPYQIKLDSGSTSLESRSSGSLDIVPSQEGGPSTGSIDSDIDDDIDDDLEYDLFDAASPEPRAPQAQRRRTRGGPDAWKLRALPPRPQLSTQPSTFT